MKILHYYISSKRSVSFETYLIELKKKGHKVVLLTTCEKGDLHFYLEENGITTYSVGIESKLKMVYYWKQFVFLRKFCKVNSIDIVFSHLQQANIIAVFAQYFMATRVIVFRHHFTNPNYDLPSKMEKRFDKVINRLAKDIVVASPQVKKFILKSERVKPEKITVIPYIYDFSIYKSPEALQVQSIQNQYPAQLLLLMCSRFVKNKRHSMIIDLMYELIVEQKLDIQLILLDEGPLVEIIREKVNQKGLSQHIHFIGYTNHFVEYMAAVDLLIHPSLSETSSSTVKEMGLLGKAVAVCKNVGDFEDYIIEGENGFLLSDSNTYTDLKELIIHLSQSKNELEKLGNNLKKTVIERFGLESSTMDLYEALLT